MLFKSRRQKQSEPDFPGHSAAPSRFVRLGSASKLTGKDQNGKEGDGGEVKGYDLKSGSYILR